MQKKATAAITFLDESGSRHRLVYQMFSSGLAQRWIDTIFENQQNEASYLHAGFFNQTEKDIPKIHKELTELVVEINYEYRIQFPKFENNRYSNVLPVYQDSVLNTDQLNTLHALFEDWGENIPVLEAKKIHFRSLKFKFFRLNELIHSYENALRTTPNKFPSMSANLDYYPTGIHKPIEPIDKIYLRNCYDWGELYLGYNTLGKDWLSVAADNDLEVVERGTVRPQTRFAAELWFSFTAMHQIHTSAVQFEAWYNSLSDHVKTMVPVDNLSSLVLGKYIIGKIVIDDYFLQFDPNIYNWYLPNSDAKKDWNANVFSTFTSAEKIEIIT